MASGNGRAALAPVERPVAPPVRPAADDEWVRCAGCGETIYAPRFERALKVCGSCGRHAVITAPERIAQLMDRGAVAPIEPLPTVPDPLGFTDLVPYPRRLREAASATGLDEAVLAVRGTIEGRPLVAAVMDFRFMGGSLGAGVGERVTAAAEEALRARLPLLIVTASGGARMQEGALALMQMVKTSQAMGLLDDAGIATLALLTDPTYGGVAASYATLPDIILAEPGARVGFAGPRVIEQTIGQRLPEGFQTAEFLLERGLVDGVVPRSELRPFLGRLLRFLAPDRPAAPPAAEEAGKEAGKEAGEEPPVVLRDPGALPVRDGMTAVRLARHADRPTAREYALSMLEEFQELHGDRLGGDCTAIIGGVGLLAGRAVVLVGHDKGRGTAERVRRGFGMPSPAGYRKAARLMRLAAKLGVPVVALIDTPGAHPGVEAEENGQAWAISDAIRLMSGLPVPTVAVVTGEGGSGGALALAAADRVLILANGVYSVISPEGCAAILWKSQSPEAVAGAADALGLQARDLLAHGLVDGVVGEPGEGAHTDPPRAIELVRSAVDGALGELSGRPADALVAARRARFRGFGTAEPIDRDETGRPHGADTRSGAGRGVD
jgi:acetyl-CoA carboxylase carboxyl transferase subunit beta